MAELRVTSEQSREVACETCGAEPTAFCTNPDGSQKRKGGVPSNHQSRQKARRAAVPIRIRSTSNPFGGQ